MAKKKKTVTVDEYIARGVAQLMEGLHYSGLIDIKDENFKETPQRVLRAFKEQLSGGVDTKKAELILEKSFPTSYTGMITMRGIEVSSMCPHHLLPVTYSCDISYIPKDRVLGASKLERFVDHLAKRAVLQEDLTEEVVDIFNKKLDPQGIMVVLTGKHMCMKCRGIKSKNSVMETSAYRGFYESQEARLEFILLGILNELREKR